ncbi:MAG: hypothetical protein IPP34_19515 [Bacteroidetes bacterium]|nr:hypothetical protein [Bacteroidota bacterium]
MKKHKILATVIKENSGYSAFATVQKHFIATEGESFEELKSHFISFKSCPNGDILIN